MASRVAKAPVEEQIRYVGLSDLDPYDQRRVQDIAVTEYNKRIKRYTKNVTSLVIHVKAYDKKKGGKGEEKENQKKKYAINIKAVTPGKIFVENKAVDWDLARCMHQGFQNLQKMIISRYKDDVSYKKPYD